MDRTQRRTALETLLASTKATISQLQSELFDICQSLNDTTPLLDLLPTDIMVEIFQLVLPDHDDPEATGYGCTVKPVQFTLAAVCRTWRRIALGFPGLWKEIRFTAAAYRRCTEVQVDLIQEWIHRAGLSPLKISLLLQREERHDFLDRILRILLQECQRWRTLEIAGNATHQLRREMSEGNYSFPILNSIFLGHKSHKASRGTVLPWIFDTGSSLRYLNLGKGSHWKKNILSVEWSTIHHFRFVGDEAVGLIFMSEMTESLRSVQAIFLPIQESDGMPFLQLPALRRLEIGNDKGPELISDVCPITSLKTPALQHLRLYLDPKDTRLPLLSAMLTQSQCSLVELSLDNLDASTNSLVQFLQVVPSLRTFSFEMVRECVLTDELIDALHPPNEQPSNRGRCLPNISNIVYKGKISFKPQNTINMLRSRLGTSPQRQTPTDAQIKTFTIFCKNFEWAKVNSIRTFYPDIAALKSLGTSLDIIYNEGERSDLDGEA